jgi:hypothetical protein
MPESAVSKIPNAHNHRDAPPGTAVKYGYGELETIERLVDIGHYEVQVTPDNCAATLISVDQIVEVRHILQDSNDHHERRGTLQTAVRPRARIARMDNAHGSHGGYNNTPPELPTVSNGTLTTTEQAPEQGGATSADLPQSRA